MGGFEIDRSGAIAFERGFPSGDANAPFVARFESRKSPFRNWGDEIVAVEHGEIEKLLGDLDAHGVKSEIFRAGAAISVTIKSGKRIAATATQFGAKNIGRHGGQ